MLVAGGQQRQIVLVNLRLNPDGRKIGHVVERRPFLHVLPFRDVLLITWPLMRRTNSTCVSALPAARMSSICWSSMPSSFKPNVRAAFDQVLIAAAFGIDKFCTVTIRSGL